jgi:hypothetical protein
MKKASLLLLMLCLGVGSAYAGPCPAQFPTSRGNGTVAGVPVANGGTQYYFKDALLSGFDCFEQLSSWFPSYITSSNSIAPTKTTVDMAYTTEGTATFSNVVVPTAGNYTLDFRYAFATGLFPGVTNRPAGIMVNGQVITSDLNFPVTGNFETFQDVNVLVPLNAGQNTVQMFNVVTQSVSRVDSMTVLPGGSTNCSTLPAAPAGFTAAENSNNNIALSWTASASPAGCTVGYYNLYRSTTRPFTASASNQIGSAVSTTKFVDTTGVCNTPYYYQVQAVDFAGVSPVAANATPASILQCPTVSSAQISAGGPGAAPYLADVDFTGGASSGNNTNSIDLSGVTAPAPLAVYKTSRNGSFSYTLAGFAPGSAHTVRLHFVEPFFSTAGSRVFNFSINTTQVTNFDIFVAAGNVKEKVVIHQSTETADANGNFVITFVPISGKNTPLANAIEVQ